ncbi:TraB/GumN family protein [Microcoleus sp. AT13-A5]|uniref:TraB/GumN family protein n=1 Tax=Microcoleus sp. AT13-A5 TaxID=2818590 RepID=UPI002FD544AA
MSRGEDRLIILSDYFPRRITEDNYVDIEAIEGLASGAEALVYGPGVVADDSVGLLSGLSMLRAYRSATRIPDGGTLETVLDAELYARWSENKALFMPHDGSVERKRPAYAASDLYQAAMNHYGVQNTASAYRVLFASFEDREDDRIDARYRLDVNVDRKQVKAFEVDEAKALACFSRTVAVLRKSLEASQEGADAWDSRDMGALRAYYDRTPAVDRCWERLINQRTAELMGAPDPYAAAPMHWVGAVESAFHSRDTLITHLPARTILTESGVVALMVERGWILRRVH